MDWPTTQPKLLFATKLPIEWPKKSQAFSFATKMVQAQVTTVRNGNSTGSEPKARFDPSDLPLPRLAFACGLLARREKGAGEAGLSARPVLGTQQAAKTQHMFLLFNTWRLCFFGGKFQRHQCCSILLKQTGRQYIPILFVVVEGMNNKQFLSCEQTLNT